jgi:transcriptional regulator with XRE-family HTH domain
MQAQSLSRIPLDYLLGMTIGRPPKSKRSAFGQRLQLLREKARLSQREVAAALGITQPSYVKWERRDIGLTVDQLKKLASILGVPVEEFFSTDDQPKRNGPVGRARKTFDALAELPRATAKAPDPLPFFGPKAPYKPFWRVYCPFGLFCLLIRWIASSAAFAPWALPCCCAAVWNDCNVATAAGVFALANPVTAAVWIVGSDSFK